MPSNNLEQRVQKLEEILSNLLASVAETRKSISEGFSKIDDNFIKIHEKIDSFSGRTAKQLKSVDFNLISIKEEIEKINLVTNYEDEISNLRTIKGGKKA